MFFFFFSDGGFLGPQTATCLSRHRPPGAYFKKEPEIKYFKKEPEIKTDEKWQRNNQLSPFQERARSKRTRNGKQNNEHLQVWAGWLVLVTASLVLPIYLAASLLADRHCTPQHSIVLPIGHLSFQSIPLCCAQQPLRIKRHF